MGASSGRVPLPRDWTSGTRRQDDFDAVFELLDARSRAAFGISEEQPETFLRSAGTLPGYGQLGRRRGRCASSGTPGSTRTRTSFTQQPTRPSATRCSQHVERPGARTRLRASRRRPPHQRTRRSTASLQRNGYARDREILRMWRPLDERAARACVARGSHRTHLHRRTTASACTRCSTRSTRLGRRATSRAAMKAGCPS